MKPSGGVDQDECHKKMGELIMNVGLGRASGDSVILVRPRRLQPIRPFREIMHERSTLGGRGRRRGSLPSSLHPPSHARLPNVLRYHQGAHKTHSTWLVHWATRPQWDTTPEHCTYVYHISGHQIDCQSHSIAVISASVNIELCR